MKILFVVLILMSSQVMAGKKPRPTPLPQTQVAVYEGISQIACNLIRNGEKINTHAAGIGAYGFIQQSRKPFIKNSEDLNPGVQYGSILTAQFRNKDLIGFTVEIVKMQNLWDSEFISVVSMTLTEATSEFMILENGDGYSMSCQVK